MRRYQEIWINLLSRKRQDVWCHKSRQDRLIKGVFKEKGKDLKNRSLYRMEIHREGEILHFQLRKRVKIIDALLEIQNDAR